VQANAYETFGRPFVRSTATPLSAKALRDLHPLRVQRAAMSSANPAMKGIEHLADTTRAQRASVDPDNPFLAWEKLTADWIEQVMDFHRDLRDAWYEGVFFSLWGGPLAAWFGKKNAAPRTLPDPETLRAMPEVEAALAHMKQGGLAEAVVRLLILLASSNQSFRAEILHRWAHVFKHEEPFKKLTVDQRQRMLREQTVIVTFDEKGAIDTLPDLLPSVADRKAAVDLLKGVIGDIPNPTPELVAMANELYDTLDLSETKQKPATPAKPAPKSRARKPASTSKANPQ